MELQKATGSTDSRKAETLVKARASMYKSAHDAISSNMDLLTDLCKTVATAEEFEEAAMDIARQLHEHLMRSAGDSLFRSGMVQRSDEVLDPVTAHNTAAALSKVTHA